MFNIFQFSIPAHFWIVFIISTICFVILGTWWMCFIAATKNHSGSKKPHIFKWIIAILCISCGIFSYSLLSNYISNGHKSNIETSLTQFVCVGKAGITTPRNIVSGSISIAGPSASASRYDDDYSIFVKDPDGYIHRINDMQIYFKYEINDTIFLDAYIKDNKYEISLNKQ